MSGKDDKGIIAYKNTKILTVTLFKLAKQDFPGCLVVKNPLANLGDMGLIADLGKSHMSRGNWAYAPKLLKPECSRACAGQQERPPQLLPSPSLLCSLHGGPMTLRGEGLRQGADFNRGAGQNYHTHTHTLGFPGGSDGKESACDAGDVGSIPGLGRSPVKGNG